MQGDSFVEMKAVTWQKDSHGLFDYETQQLIQSKYRIDNKCRIMRQDNEIALCQEENNTGFEYLTSVVRVDEKFFVSVSEANSENYLIVRSLKGKEGVQKGYGLQPGDVLKLGRTEYCVIEMLDQHGKLHVIPRDDWFSMDCDTEPEEGATCRICMDGPNDDPLITPCSCKGTCQYIHFNCLKKWIEIRAQIKEVNNSTTYKWKKLDCEVCEQTYPQTLNINSRKHHLVEINRPSEPYIILQSTVAEKKQAKALYIVKSTHEDSIKLGRGHQCDIRIQDISVSRIHASIKYENGQFLLIDNNSKFGTLIKISKQFPIKEDKIAVQIGRTVLTFVHKS